MKDIRTRLSALTMLSVLATATLFALAPRSFDPARAEAPFGQVQLSLDPCILDVPLPRGLKRMSMSRTAPSEEGISCPIDRGVQS